MGVDLEGGSGGWVADIDSPSLEMGSTVAYERARARGPKAGRADASNRDVERRDAMMARSDTGIA